jgi:hypothetical protein
MKKLLLILLCLPMIGFGQNVNIPDANFKAYLVGEPLINTNGDTEIQVSEANTFNGGIYCGGMNIADLTGIESFINLTHLHCHNNQLNFLDISQNLNLESLGVNGNQLSFLNLNQNTSLLDLNLSFVNPTNIDFSMLLNLTSLWFENLSELDLSHNTMLDNLGGMFNSNSLTYLNIQNGNNINMNCDGIIALSCGSLANDSSLSCIQVDDVAWSNLNWSSNINTTFQYFSTNCPPATTIQEFITNKEILKVTDLLGRETKGTKNEPLLYIYDDGTVEKKITID